MSTRANLELALINADYREPAINDLAEIGTKKEDVSATRLHDRNTLEIDLLCGEIWSATVAGDRRVRTAGFKHANRVAFRETALQDLTHLETDLRKWQPS